MNKSHISSRIICPKCGTQTMRPSLSENNFGKEYFADCCHGYFGIVELVNIWNYDGADFIGSDYQFPEDKIWLNVVKVINEKKYPPRIHFSIDEEKVVATKWFEDGSTYSCDEPVWSSKIARDESYEVVNRMFQGIEEWEEVYSHAGVPYPICACGTC